MSIYKDLESITTVALHYAKDHGCNYNIIIFNPNSKGEFDSAMGSTYEFVADSYFEKSRPNVILLHKTDDLIKEEAATKTSASNDYEVPQPGTAEFNNMCGKLFGGNPDKYNR